MVPSRPERGDGQPRRVEWLELVLLGDLDPGARGEWPERAEAVDVGSRRRLGQYRHAALRQLGSMHGRDRPRHRDHHERRASASSSSRVRYAGTSQSVVMVAARSAIAGQDAGDPKLSGQRARDPQVELGAPAGRR